ncbi:crossover junction endodeoxyribonuclease RuvC [Pyramidobacter piscolens W5455]|uniref:Crossover junction endodeoxyribonuclease RuvC n=1 Tax=Pyramidobacter piscolens W5455 TaxID=352165 RepID=A0ABM9ZY46_9BACT|nr:crossover junction endodeoxyribonuclease RuvC [Pyramidobacter piscolens]EFB91815.1 crossover junction endodeoxyribonuclease RuvC [Pyramidobacter piscolens W5455]
MPATTKGLVCLGIDPGIGRLGYGFVCQSGSSYRALAYGCLETPPHQDTSVRIKALYDGVREQIENCSPHFMSVERLYFGQNRTTAEAVWQVRGAILLLGAQYRLPIIEPKPSEVKLTVCGDGTAEKRQVQLMIQQLLNLPEIPRPDDTADALGIALAGLAIVRSPQYAYGRR